MQEVELKLELDEDAAELLQASEVLSGPAQCADLRAIYFDTPDSALRKAGYALRIRARGGQHVQTVKASAAAEGLFRRTEWEFPVAGFDPVLDDATPIRALLGAGCDALAPVFEVSVERRIWNIDHHGGQIEVALDRGQVSIGERSTRICEIELELKHGEPGALFSLARVLDAVAPVRLGVLSKSERGYRLSGPLRPAVKAGAIVLDDAMSAAEAFRAIGQHCLRQFRLNEALLEGRRNAAALHQARVALRRLRSAFSLFMPLYGADPQAARLRAGLRTLAGVLGEARNLDVLLDRTLPGSLHDRLSKARNAAYEQVGMALHSPKARALMLDLSEWLALGAWLDDEDTKPVRDEPVRDLAGRVLARARRKLKKHGADIASLDDEARHEVRKDAKKLRYASEFFAALFRGKHRKRRYKRFIAALEALQDKLGALNDLATAPDEIRKLGAQSDRQAMALMDEDGKGELVCQAAQAHAHFVEAKRFWR